MTAANSLGSADGPRAVGPVDGPRLSCTGVTVRFGGVVAVDSVDLEVPPATVVGLVGPNGAGKSTLFAVLSGLLRPTAGRVFLDGHDITGFRPQRRAERGLARTFQHPELFAGLTAREHLVLAYRAKHASRRVWSDLFTMGSLKRADPDERARVDELVELLGMTDLAPQPALGLPLGQARVVELGRALATSPTVVLLDEPSSGLDTADSARFEATLSRVVAETGLSVLLVEHDVDLVMRVCRTVNVLDFGTLIASGPPASIRADAAVRAAYLGEQPTPSTELDVSPAAVTPTSTTVKPDAARLSATESVPHVSALSAPDNEILRVQDLCVGYGEAMALSHVSFTLRSGEALAVLGPNGAGKSTLARAISGLVRATSGRIVLRGEDISRLPGHRIRRQGVLHLPEGRGVFRALTVTDNLKMAAAPLPTRQARNQAVDLAFELFPRLAQRRRKPAALLSGGEQQMLSLARALVTSPALLVADEMSLGLAPIMVDMVFDGLERARSAGVSIVMVEQYVHRALGFADRCMVLQRGEVAWSGAADAALEEMPRHYLGDGMVVTQ